MNTPIHSISVDFDHVSEARFLHRVILGYMHPSNSAEQDNYLSGLLIQIEEAIELLESLEA
ncbi:hypothetical protein VR7878_03961 [Vibrio ruber DSM 16370]|uniref:Uncharacterized protein n=1 Tax=Vibrio ruber (strain DSM 16370 / JCM 11486 / BCRC 17186 / CECT 7878 / LMG 23124 / VR1) TaxID=1123498 RepID=A0A1R4LUQ1_VIBR1|nr:hypothetical protein [Vibrio ruber]SJN60057.1 hypothetical protein VR7878_03961 [Vibrio ruber DSM 16370]